MVDVSTDVSMSMGRELLHNIIVRKIFVGSLEELMRRAKFLGQIAKDNPIEMRIS